MFKRTFLSAAAACLCAFAQQSGPALSIDAAANRHAISPDVYGISYYWDLGDAKDPAYSAKAVAASNIRASVRRWGGNGTSTYHWKFDIHNIAADWFFEVLPDMSVDASKLPEGSQFNNFADQVRTTGGKILGTIPVLGWLPKAREEMCSFTIAKYGPQCTQDPYGQYHKFVACGDGIEYSTSCKSNPKYITGNDPYDAYAQFDERLQEEWIRYLVTRYGKANQGGVNIWSLGNEPIWWDNTHRDIHPDPYTYDELINVNIKYAEAIKRADPTALVSGPVGDNWASLWMSKKDIVAGWARGNWYADPVDRKSHDNIALVPWYLQQMKKYADGHGGKRLLDILDLHAYIEPSALHTTTETDATRALRLDSTREFWDPTYVVSGDYWIKDPETGGPIAPAFIPRVKQMIEQNYPGTKLAITEYNWTAMDTLNGGLAQAELLGIFGREGLDIATLWGPPKPTDPGAFAFKIYRNYDGIGGTFGETGVQSTSADQSKLSVFGALRSDLNLTAIVINKTNNDLASKVSLSNFTAGPAAKVWRYSGAKLDAIVQQPDAAVAGGSIATTFPANSITLLVIPPAAYPVSKPQVAAVTNVASYDKAIVPGQMVAIFGKDMGPKDLAYLRQEENGLVSTTVEGVRILFDGVPSPIVYVSATQCSAVVPYFGASNATTHVQVEYQGVRSDPLEIQISPTGPGLFTADYSGKGQGAITNQDNSANSQSAPASPDSVVILWGTGEGLTNPPGVDGRLAVEVLPKPLAPVSVEIGGLPATVEYAGAAPYNMPGLFQVNARISKDVQPGDKVPVRTKVGALTSQDGVTLVVR